jgi:uncharacterized protein (DUF1778 family)
MTDRRTDHLTVRLSPAERDAIERAAADRGIAASTWLRRLALAVADPDAADQIRQDAEAADCQFGPIDK